MPDRKDDMAFHHQAIERLTQQILAKGDPGDTVARAIERLGDQHPLVRQRDSAVRGYRRAMSAQFAPLGQHARGHARGRQ